MTIDIGYYTLFEGSGTTAQGLTVSNIGQNGIDLTALNNFTGLEVAYVNNSDYRYNRAWNDNQAVINAYVNDGGVFVFHDRASNGPGGYQPDAFLPEGNQVNFVDDTGQIANGVFGALNDGSLDGLTYSNTGFVDVDDIQDGEFAVLLTRDDPTHGVTTLQAQGQGFFVWSSLGVHYFADPALGNDPEMMTYIENVLDWAGEIAQLNRIDGLGGDDNLVGTLTWDRAILGAGNDTFSGGDGEDYVSGEAGKDRILGGLMPDYLWGGGGADRLDGGSGNDQLWGGAKNDKLFGGVGHDYLVGGTGKDRLYGEQGKDTLLGNDGDDILVGGVLGDDDNDVFVGGDGNDTMSAGDGTANVFRFAAGDAEDFGGGQADTITDFLHAGDKIDLTAFGASFTFTTGLHTGTANEIRLVDTATGTNVSIDLDGDFGTDEFIVIHTVAAASVTSGDFVT